MNFGSQSFSARTREDVLAILPDEYKRNLDDAIRDALADALLALLQKADEAADFAAAQSDPAYAVDACEDGLFEDRSVPRADGEENEAYRERALAVPAVVTFTAIRDAVNAILAAHTDKTCRISDSTLDRWFVGGHGDRAWHSYIGRSPSYPERLFDFPEGAGVAGNDPGGARLFNGQVGRSFLLRIPDLYGLGQIKFLPSAHGTDPLGHKYGVFVGQSASRAFIGAGQYNFSVYRAVALAVNRLVGHSVRWTLLVDPKL